MIIKKFAYSIFPAVLIDQALSRKRELRYRRKNKELIRALLSGQGPIKLELGAEMSRGLKGWTTVDINGACDLRLDLSLPLPLPEDCVDQIYSSHLLEHFSYPHPLRDLLRECHRVLKPGGGISVAVPNARTYLEAYFQPGRLDEKKYCTYDTGLSYRCKIDYVNYMAYMGGHHHHMFDEESLIVILSDAGFKNVRLRDYDPALDLEKRRYESIYAEGEK